MSRTQRECPPPRNRTLSLNLRKRLFGKFNALSERMLFHGQQTQNSKAFVHGNREILALQL